MGKLAQMTLHEYLASTAAIPAQQLADKLGCTASHISRLRHGSRRPSLAMALRIEQETFRRVKVADWADAPVRDRRAA